MKKIEESLRNTVKDLKKEIVDSGLIKDGYRIFGQEYSQNRKTYHKYYCSKCKHIWDEEIPEDYYRRRDPVCPSCGLAVSPQIIMSWSDNLRWDFRRYYLKEIDGGFVLADFMVYFTLYSDRNNPFDWLTKTPNMTVVIDNALIFTNDEGFAVMPSIDPNKPEDSKIARNGTNVLKDSIHKAHKKILSSFLINASSLTTPAKTWEKNIQDYENEAEARAQEKKSNSRAARMEDFHKSYVPKTIDFTKKPLDVIFSEQIGGIGNKFTYECFCTRCKNTFTTTRTRESSVVCPTCGLEYDDMSWSSHQAIVYFITYENTNLPENDLLIRLWSYDVRLENKNGVKNVQRLINEVYRVFCGKKIAYYSVEDKDLEKTTYGDCSYYFESHYARNFQDDDEIIFAINNSCLRHSGTLEALGFKEPAYQKIGRGCLYYINAWYKNKGLEFLYKAHLDKIVDFVMLNPKDAHICNTGKTPHEVLRISKAAFKIVAKLNLDLETTKLVQACWEDDPNITPEKFEEMNASTLDINAILELRTNYGLKVQDIVKYIQAACDHQCIEKPEIITIWSDYLRMAKDLNIDLTDKTRLFPSSLKKEHDVATFAYREVRQNVDQAIFAKQAQENIDKYGNYSYKDLFIVIPMCPEDVVNEATQQKNCLKSYVTRIKNGQTVVCFIRRKDAPKTSYITVEVYHNNITQIKGYCNSNPRDKNLMEFISHWATAKSIGVTC